MARQKVYTLIYIDDKGDPSHETYHDVGELEDRLASIQPDDPRYLLVDGEVVPFQRETRVTIGAAAKKPRAPRADKGKTRVKKNGASSGAVGAGGASGFGGEAESSK